MSEYLEKIQKLREIIDKTVKELLDQDLVELKGWILVIIDKAKWRSGSYGVHYIGDDIIHGYRTIHEDYHYAPEVFGESMKEWFKKKIER